MVVVNNSTQPISSFVEGGLGAAPTQRPSHNEDMVLYGLYGLFILHGFFILYGLFILYGFHVWSWFTHNEDKIIYGHA